MSLQSRYGARTSLWSTNTQPRGTEADKGLSVWPTDWVYTMMCIEGTSIVCLTNWLSVHDDVHRRDCLSAVLLIECTWRNWLPGGWLASSWSSWVVMPDWFTGLNDRWLGEFGTFARAVASDCLLNYLEIQTPASLLLCTSSPVHLFSLLSCAWAVFSNLMVESLIFWLAMARVTPI